MISSKQLNTSEKNVLESGDEQTNIDMTPCNKPQTKLLRSNTLQGPRHNFKAAAVVAKIQLTTENEEREPKTAKDLANKTLKMERAESATGFIAKPISSVPSSHNIETENT